MRSVPALFIASAVGMALWSFSHSTAANMSYSPWVHELNQVGQDVEVTVQVFEDASIDLVEGEMPLPDLDSTYTLTRGGHQPGTTLFEDRTFSAEEAFEVTDYGCQSFEPGLDSVEPDFCQNYPESCVDCDDDSEPECYGFCAVAYRFEVLDECVPPGSWYYAMSTPESEQHGLFHEGEGLGSTNTGVQDTGDSCLDDDDSGCSVSGVGGDAGAGPVTAAVLVLAGLIALARSRRKKYSRGGESWTRRDSKP